MVSMRIVRLALISLLLLPVDLILLPMGVGGVVPPQSQPGKMAAQTGATFRPGDIVGEEVVARRGVSSFFSVSKISDSVFERMRGRSYKEGCRVARTYATCSASTKTRRAEASSARW